MKKFFIFISWIIITNTQFIHAMLKLNTSSKAASYKSKRYISTIVPYDKSRDEKIISAIAFKSMPRLISGVTKKNREALLDDAIMPTINNPYTTTHVYLIDGKATGFINYCTYLPIYTILIPSQFHLHIKNHAIIQMLAVDEEHQKKGIGSALVKKTLEDLEKEYVSKVTLGTTDSTLDTFYEQLGFKRKGGSVLYPSGPSQFTKYISE